MPRKAGGSVVPPVCRSILAAAILTPGCVTVHRAAAAPPPGPPRGLVLVVDGAGGFEGASRHFRQAAAESCLPFDVETFDWSHGYLRILADHLHLEHAREQGHRLAARII